MQLILIELNEINFEYVKKYFNKLEIGTIKEITDKIINTNSEEEYKLLEPWIQWHTIHTGCSAKEHGVFRLGDVIYSSKSQIFEELEQKNFKVGSVSAMNTINNLKNPSYFIPDPWTNTKSDGSYFSKIITNVLKDTVNNNASGKFKIKNYLYLILIFLKFTRIKKYKLFLKLFYRSFFGKWRKALFLDLLIHEIHLNLFKNKSPNLSCVFYNAGAHIQHHYLFNSLANETSLKNPENLLNKSEDPFEETLLIYNEILADYKDLGKNILLATGLTQKIIKEPQYYYRLLNHENFLKKINIKFIKVEPRMSRDFLIHFNDNNERDLAFKTLDILKLKNQKLFGILESRNKSLFVTLTYKNEIFKDDQIEIAGNKINIFRDVIFVAVKNGEHHGRGYLFVDGEIKKKFNNVTNINIMELKNKINSFFSKNSNELSVK